jgi:hypothetical protein
MGQRVVLVSDGHRIEGCGPDGEFVNRFLAHLESRAFSSATVRAYAYDLLNFLRFLAGREARLADVVATDLFDYLDWQQRPAGTAGQAGRARRRVRGGTGDDEPADRRGARPVRVRGDDRDAGGEPGAGRAAVYWATAQPPRPAGAYWPGPAAQRRAAGAPAAAAA